MERAAKSLARLKSNALVAPEDLARSAWPVAVGARLAARTRAVRMVRSTLIVEVEDAVWPKPLHQLRYQILQSFQKVLGDNIVEDLEFRIGIPRRPPQVATAASPSMPHDAEAIGDPVLRTLYQRSKKKAIS
jgi:predicted nucleic acid-binding Zn ribbon protein